MSINERFETIIRVLFSGNKRAFAKAVGISPTVVENVVGARKGNPSYDVLVKVCSNANISAEWLLLGTGEMLMDMFNFRKELHFSSADPEEDIDDSEQNTPPSLNEDNSTIPNNTGESALIAHLDKQVKEKDKEIGVLHEDIGRLKERIAQLEREKNDSLESLQTAPEVLSTSTVD